jgi:putative transposase
VRHPRILVQDIPYHVFARGNNRQTLFHGDEDRLFYLGMLEKAHSKFDFTVFSYVLMSNHFHFLLQMLRNSTLSGLMHWLQLGYARYYNRKYNRVGHVFQCRYFSPVVEKETYFLTVDRYIHLNPVRAGMVCKPEHYKWSSYLNRLSGGLDISLDHETVLDYFGADPKLRIQAYQTFTDDAITKREEWSPQLLEKIVVHGSSAFLKEILEHDAQKTLLVQH